MESKFKVGDRVKRISGAHNGMRIGDEATVTHIVGKGLILDKYRKNKSTSMSAHSETSFEVIKKADEPKALRRSDIEMAIAEAGGAGLNAGQNFSEETLDEYLAKVEEIKERLFNLK